MTKIQIELTLLKNTMSEMKTTWNGINKLDSTEEIYEIQYIIIEMIQYETQRKK